MDDPDRANASLGFCDVIISCQARIGLHRLFMTHSLHLIRDRYPELYAYRPEENEDAAYWFPRKDRKRRYDIVCEILAELESRMSRLQRLEARLNLFMFRFTSF